MKRDIHTYVGGPFRAHGQIEMWREGDVIRLRGQGPFNREAVLGLGAAMADLLTRDPPPAVFGDILELRGSMVTSPDSMEELGQFMARMAAHRSPPVAVAYVAGPEVEGRDFMLPLFEALYQKHGRRFGAFGSLDDAKAWMAEQLKKATAKDSA
ncbi:hypothetical protein CDN99_21145 [Roseateles aquatilis]|uniref:STAS/SEC14 domain-containing protein n=1 Tax=Roseateles aquatilis TaxID=431061 RepID=A0A246J155_9BURK|nr:hypothetical protein [Roseateles aquatilis]OWQ86339.1 hypothetical protein CDN99_21145 [Roseateles aquatilis]